MLPSRKGNLGVITGKDEKHRMKGDVTKFGGISLVERITCVEK
jgi:hypothetical protein